MYRLIDSHCHLDFPVFDDDRALVIERSKALNVTQFVVPSVTSSTFSRVHALKQLSSDIHVAFGLHPCFMEEHQECDLELLRSYCQRFAPCAIGEIGLDFHLPQADKERQRAFFQQQLDLANEFNLPVILHVRKAHAIVLDMLKNIRLTRGGIIHAYSGSMEQAKEYMKLGFKLGFGGVITYEGSKRVRKIATELPLESIVLETDAPDMPLSGQQGLRNSPERVVDVLHALAQLRAEPVEVLARATTQNIEQLLGLPNYS